MGIDFIIIWVDGKDENWRKKKNAYKASEKGDDSDIRYRDWGLLKYWFRGVETFAPWVRKIYFVSDNQCPDWLNKNNGKLHIISHEEFIPKKYLPTFNSHTIELNLHRIKGLSEQFVYFNDDVFLTKPTAPEFFFKNGEPCDCFGLEGIYFSSKSIGWIAGSCVAIVNDNFNLRKSVKCHWKKYFSINNGWKKVIKSGLALICCREWFPGFYHAHTSYSFLKSSFEQVWENSFVTLNETCMHKFREKCDVSPRAIKNWQLASGTFVPCKAKSMHCYHLNDERVQKIEEIILNQKFNVICVNDTENITSFEISKVQLNIAFGRAFSQKSSFEK